MSDWKSAPTARLDADDGKTWLDGTCHCAVPVRRDADGVLAHDGGARLCHRCLGVRVDQHGEKKMHFEVCNPNEQETPMGINSDASDEVQDAMIEMSRARRDYAAATAWKNGASAAPDARLDAKTAAKGTKGMLRGLRDLLRQRLGDQSITKGDSKRMVGAHPNLTTLSKQAQRSLLATTRAARAETRTTAATSTTPPARAEAAAAPAPHTDALDDQEGLDDMIDSARHRRDYAAANAWRTGQ